MKILSSPVRNAVLIGVASGILAIAGYLLMWALWYAIAPHPYSMYVVDARAPQEGLFMLVIMPVATALFVLATNARCVRTGKDALLSAVLSGMVSGATLLLAAVAGLFRLFFSMVPGPFDCESLMFCGSTAYDSMINDPLLLYYLSPHGNTLTPLQGALSVLFDVLVAAFKFMFIPAVLTAFFALMFFLHAAGAVPYLRGQGKAQPGKDCGNSGPRAGHLCHDRNSAACLRIFMIWQ